MKVATWNVNSIQKREGVVLDWLEAHDPDVLCMQETKSVDQAFPEDPFGDIDYDVVYFGQRAYNGVAIAAHEEFENVHRGFPQDDKKAEKRLLAATVDGVRIINIYLPNGQALDSDKYAYKLKWMDQLADYLKETCDPHQPLILLGDFNLCPEDRDAWDHAERQQGLFCSPKERARFQRYLDWGLTDMYRHFHPDVDKAFTWWDYRGGGWERNHGMRIDHILVTAPLLERATDVQIHRRVRGEHDPSDHVPVMIELQD